VEADETTTFYAAQSHQLSLRLPLTISEIQPGFVPFGPPESPDPEIQLELDAQFDAELDAMLLPWLYGAGYVTGGRYDGQGAIAPSGNFVLRTPPGPGVRLIIEEWTQSPSGAPPLILVDGINNDIVDAQWSPDGQTIAMVENGMGGLGEGSILTQPASGASAPKLVMKDFISNKPGHPITTYSQPVWSPDSKYLAVIRRQYTSGGELTGAWLMRVTLADGKKLDLVPVADDTELLRWTADNDRSQSPQ
jgi:dipeptidyl aminopeptidase/acylaminoacyl peptidase